MKLAEYIIQEQIASSDWRGAASTILAEHGIFLPVDQYDLSFPHGSAPSPVYIITVYLPYDKSNFCYSWGWRLGFMSAPRSPYIEKVIRVAGPTQHEIG